MFNSHHCFWYIPGNISKICYSKQEILKIKPTTLQHYIVNEYFAPIIESTGPQKKQTIPDWATNGSFEKLFITQRLAISWPFYTWWDNQQSPRSRHIIDHCITSSKRDGKRVWVYASDADVVVLLIAHRNLLCAAEMFTLESSLKILTSIVFLSFLGIKNLFFGIPLSQWLRYSWKIS